MKNRYKVHRTITGWIVYDNQANEIAALISSRREARAACQRLNESEVLARADQQQSREETI